MHLVIAGVGWGLFIGVAALVLVNVLAIAFARLAPGLVQTPEERRRFDYMARFEGPLADYRASWFDIAPEDWPDFSDEYRRHELNIYEYDAFCEYKHPARSGRFINYSGDGFRFGADQAPWPPTPDHFVVFFFGGSTTLGVGPDWTTVPSLCQQRLRERLPHGVEGRPIAVYNFGRGAYFSTLEVALFQKLLRDGQRCDLAIFLDGINDSFFEAGVPPTAGVYGKALQDMNAEISALTKAARRMEVPWVHLRRFLAGLPVAKLIDVAVRWSDRKSGAAGAATQALPPDSVERIIARLRFNYQTAADTAARHGVRTHFVWQPSPAYRYDLSNHVVMQLQEKSLHGHERAGDVYPRLAGDRWKEIAPPPRLWLGDMQDGMNEALYVDSVHYTAGFSRRVAERIADDLVDREILG